ncbi:MAG TPA: sigma-70 family RNA polymerase sigma factor [Candidatus Dormibacteraeota bacterium]
MDRMKAQAASSMTDDPKPDLPRHAAQAPAEPFEALFMAEYGRVVAVANRVLADRTEAEDVAQEVFLDFHRRYRPDVHFAGPWLHAAAAHTALNRIRGRRRRERRELNEAQTRLREATPDPAHQVEIAEQRRAVRQALARLKPKAAAVLVLRYSGLSYAEVGAALNVGAGQVGTLLRRAEQALKKELERSGSPV